MHDEDLTRPIIGIALRTPQEVFDIMADRFRHASRTLLPANTEADLERVARALRDVEWGTAGTWEEADAADRLYWLTSARAAISALSLTRPEPIPMLLFCPSCGVKHVDEPEPGMVRKGVGDEEPWTNPPHRSHLCHACYTIWRPADVPTTGVARIETTGKADTIDLNPVDSLTRPAGGEEAIRSKAFEEAAKVADGLVSQFEPAVGTSEVARISCDAARDIADGIRALATPQQVKEGDRYG